MIQKVQVIGYQLHTEVPEYLLLQRPEKFGSIWQPITGHVEEGESLLSAASREVQEEIGSDRAALIPLGEPFTFKKRGNEYQEYIFAAHVHDPVRLSPEHVAFAWLPYAEALSRLPYPTQKQALTTLDGLLNRKH